MSDERPLPAERLAALGAAVRRALPGDVPPAEEDGGRARALAAFTARRRPAARRLAALAAAALVAVAVALLAWPPPPLRCTLDGVAARAGAYVHAPPGGTGATVRCSDGSVVAFAAGSSGRLAAIDARGARVLVESGVAAVRVAHRPGARWSFEAGPFAIAVLGTVFDVAWSAASQTLEVDLREGAVSVRGPLSPGGIELRAGQRLVARATDGTLRIDAAAAPAPETVPTPPAAPDTTAPGTAAPAPPPPAPPPSLPRRAAPPPPRAERWPERVAAGDFRGVLADAEARGLDAVLAQAPLADLAALADAARYAGRGAVARRALLAQRDRFAASAEARAAAFLLGRLADDGGSPAEARSWYDRYLVEAPAGAVAAEALGRKMMALHRAGDPAAPAVAAAYLRRHPDGPHAAAAREIAGP
jgi:hypothetical protein